MADAAEAGRQKAARASLGADAAPKRMAATAARSATDAAPSGQAASGLSACIRALRLGRHSVAFKFGCTGLIAAAVNLGAFQLMLQVGLHKFLASPIATEISILCNFFINDHWTFGGRRMAGSKRSRGLKHNLVALATLSLSYATFIGLSLLFPQASPVLLQACGIVPAAALNYVLHSRWTFREKAGSADSGAERRPATPVRHGG